MSTRWTGIVLCGGRSLRMHRPKALLPWRGRTLVQHLVARLAALTDEVVVVSSAELSLPALDARVVVDRVPGRGPLAGIREGLAAASTPLALVTSVDLPRVDAAFVEALLGRGTTAACAVGGVVQPFPAVYATDLDAKADALLAAGRGPVHLLEAAGIVPVPGDDWAARGVFHGFNTPDGYLEALARDGAQGTVRVEVIGAGPRGSHRADPATAATILDALDIGPPARVTLEGHGPLADLAAPVGPGERLLVEPHAGRDAPPGSRGR